MHRQLLAAIILLAGCTNEPGAGATGALGTPTPLCDVMGRGSLPGGDLVFGHVTGTTTGTSGSWTHDGSTVLLGDASWVSCRINGITVADFGGDATYGGAAGYAYRAQVQDVGTGGTPGLVLGTPAIETVTATRYYRPTRWDDGEVTITDRAVVTVPSELPVTVGNAGNGWAWLTFERSEPFDDTVRCRYRGGAHDPLPCDADDLAGGASYVFHDCQVVDERACGHDDEGEDEGYGDDEGDEGVPLSIAPGDSVDVTSMTLHVHTGAHSLPSRRSAQTTVSVDFEVAPFVVSTPMGDVYRIWVYDTATGALVLFREGELAAGDIEVRRL